MTWERRRLARQKVEYDSLNNEWPLVYQVVNSGAKVTPTSATIAIYDPSGTVTGITAGTMTVSGTLLTYELDTTTEASWPVGKGYRAEVTAIIPSAQTLAPRHFFFDVAKYVFRHTVTVESLHAYYDGLVGMEWKNATDMATLIDALADNFQTKMEAKILDAERLRLEWLVDPSIVDTAFRSYVVSHVLHVKGSHDEGNRIGDEYKSMLEAVLSTYPIDQNEAGVETTKEGGLVEVRLET